MYKLFELVRLLSVRRESTRQGPVEITRFAWRENGECSLLALLCSNDQLLIRWSVSGKAPVVKQLPWAPEKQIAAMCFDPTVSWLLVVTESPCLYILPALALMDPTARVNQLWNLSDCTVIPVSAQSTLCAACWWQTLDHRQVAIVTTKVGELLFVDLLNGHIVTRVTIDIQVNSLALIHDDDQMSTSLLITGVSNGQWKMLLEAKTQIPHYSPDCSLLSDMDYIDIDEHTIPPRSVLDFTGEGSSAFAAQRIPQAQNWVMLHPQFARGRHFVTAHDQKSSTLQVYDSEIQFLPLFVYKLPPGAETVILTDRLTLTLSRRNGSQLLVLSNQRAEASVETLQDLSSDAVIQRLELPEGEKIVGACQRSFPFYWHDKREEQQRQRLHQNTSLELSTIQTDAFDIPVTSHTVLDGCIIVTDNAVYECRPRASPERLFLQYTLGSTEMGLAEHLAISVGLDITMLAELAAHYLLKGGHISQAIHLFALSKCSHSKRCASLAGRGCIPEMTLLLKQALQNSGLELNSSECKLLMDMLLHCYVHQLADQSQQQHTPHTKPFREFLLGSFSFDESVALDLLAEYGLTTLLLDFAMSRGLVADALETLVAKSQLPVAVNLLTELLARGFSAHVLQASQGGVLCSLLAHSVTQLLATNPQLVTRQVSLIKYHVRYLESPLLLQLAAILDPSHSSVRGLLRRLTSTLHRTVSLASITSSSSLSDWTDISQDGVSMLSQILETFLLIVLHINYQRDNHQALTAEAFLSDPCSKSDSEGQQEGEDDSFGQHLALQFSLASCGSQHTAVIRDGELYTWGRTSSGRLGNGDVMREGSVSGPVCVQTFHMLHIRVEAVACGGEHTLAITHQGMYGWGNSKYGQVGVGTRHVYHRPMLLEALLTQSCVAVQCGQYHSLALTSDCRVWSWGWGVHGQLGHGDPEDQLTPKLIQSLTGRNITRVSAGYCHSLVLTELGEVLSFGCGFFGQLGTGSMQKQTSPVVISTFTEPVSVIGTKYFHSVAVTESNSIYIWGCHPHNLRYTANTMRRARQMGQQILPPSGEGMELFNLPLLVDNTFVRGKVVQVSCGSLHTCLLTVEGEVFVWGRNLEGQLGIGSRQDERIPKMLTRINTQHIIHLSSGGDFNVALDADYSVWVWGKNDFGQLGLVKSDLAGQGHKAETGQLHHFRQSNLVTSDVIVPTAHRGLAPVNVSATGHWSSSSLQGPSAALHTIQWVEDGEENGEDLLLPNLQSLSSSDLPYPSKIVPVVVKYLGDYLDKAAVLQHCLDLEEWVTAAQLCMLDDRHVQALCYRLLGLSKVVSKLSQDSFADLSSQVISHHLRLAEQEGSWSTLREQQLSTMCLQIVNHWIDHHLPIRQLQQLLQPHLFHLAPCLARLLFRYQVAQKEASDSDQYYCQYFTPFFCLSVLDTVLTNHSPAASQLLQLCLPDQLPPQTAEGSLSLSQHDGHEGRSLSQHDGQEGRSLSLLPESSLIPYSRVWQDIMRSVSKTSSSTNCISLSRNHLDHLSVQNTDGEDEGGSSAGAVVLFTCGHHFKQSAFTDVILATWLKELGTATGHLASWGKLPATAALLHQYYQRQGLLPLACPKCVLNVLKV